MFIFKGIRFAITFAISFAILSISYNNKTLFERITTWVSPIKKDLSKHAEKAIDKGWNETKDFSKKLFSNSNPKKSAEDLIKSAQSGVKKKSSSLSKKIIKREELENLDDQDVEMLNRLLNEEE
jgi:hypothetical protein